MCKIIVRKIISFDNVERIKASKKACFYKQIDISIQQDEISTCRSSHSSKNFWLACNHKHSINCV